MSKKQKGLVISVVSILIVFLLFIALEKFMQKDKNVLRCAIADDPGTLDVQRNMNEYGISLNVFDRLVEYEPCAHEITQVRVSLAEKYDISIDGLTYTFYLRENVRFHNGRKFTAEDVVYTFNRILEPKTKSEGVQYLSMVLGAKEKMEGKAEDVKGIKALDEKTVEITLENPYAPFMAGLATTACSIYDKETCEEQREIGTGDKSTVGTGPFILKEWKHGKSIYLEKNKDYFWGTPKLDGISYRVIKDIREQEKLFRNGKLDMLNLSYDVAHVKYFNAGENSIFKLPSGGGYCYILNENVKPFSDVKVRKAVQMAIDRKALLNKVYFECGVLMNGVIPNEVFSYNPQLPEIKYNREKSSELLREAGYDDGFDIELAEVSGGSETIHMMNEEVKKMLGEIGIKVSIKQMDSTSFENLKKDGKLPFYLSLYEENVNDPDNYMYEFFTPENTVKHSINYNNKGVAEALESGRGMTDTKEFLKYFVRYEHTLTDSNKNRDALIKESIETQSKTIHPNDRIRFYNELEKRIVHEDAAIVPLFSPEQVYITNPRVKNLDFNWNGYNKMSYYKIYMDSR